RPPSVYSIPVDFLTFDAGALSAQILSDGGKQAAALQEIAPLAERALAEPVGDAETAPVAARALLWRGAAYQRLGQLENARTAYEQVLAGYPHAVKQVERAAMLLAT